MKNYTFDSLSSLEFEHLSRDLLQQELGLTLESFAPGRDGGIDARWVGRNAAGGETVVVQCKHYVKSGFKKLLFVLANEEKKKLDRLKPDRYILTTSVALTPTNKTAIIKAISPHPLHPGDIHGADGMNNLLGRHEHVERQHYKLWLTSTAALTKLYTAPTFLDSEAAVARMRERLKRYVQNESFPRALEHLERSRFCLIVGNPGIGKTTLAEALLVHHVDRGYEALRITNRLSELKGLTDSKRKQIFYYDDFLGTTGLDKNEHNEDSRLTEFLDHVADTPNWRFVLTTRDYILNAARSDSEALARFPFDVATCVVEQEDYTRPIKARILYNHLYFSVLPAATKLALVEHDEYKKVVEHPNYNPRVIEHMTDSKRLKNMTASDYRAEFIGALDDPSRVWDHAFRRHISIAARHVLLALFTLPDGIQLADLSRAFHSLHELRRREHNITTSPDDFEVALKELDGNFVLTETSFVGLTAKFQNPSVRDFLEQHLFTTEADAHDLIRIAHKIIQFRHLWNGRRGARLPAVFTHIDEFITRIGEIIAREATYDRVLPGGVSVRFNWEGEWQQLDLALTIHDAIKSAASLKLVGVALDGFINAMKRRDLNNHDVAMALDALNRGRIPPGKRRRVLLRLAKEMFLSCLEDMDDFVRVGDLVKRFPKVVAQDEQRRVAAAFREAVESRVKGLQYMDQPAELRDEADQIEEVAFALDVDVHDEIDDIRSWANKQEDEDAGEEAPGIASQLRGGGGRDDDEDYSEIDKDFALYREELRSDYAES